MSYLFGDSAPSPFRINFIEFLRMAMDFSVHVLRVEGRVVDERTKRAKLEKDVETDRRRLQQLLSTVTDVARRESTGAAQRVSLCAEDIENKALQAVEAGLQGLTNSLAKEVAEIDETIKRARKSSAEALEKLLYQFDLPQARNTVHVRLTDARYGAWLESETPYGLETVVELTIPPDSPFVNDARVDKFVEGLELHAPETAGWLRKESKMTPHKVGRFYVIELDAGDDHTSFKLRSSVEPSAAGYDIVIRKDEPLVRVVRVGKDAEGAPAFETEPADILNLLRFGEALAEAAQGLASKRRTLVSAQIAKKPLEESEDMRRLVEQLIAVMAPQVRELAQHSLSPVELVLRRMIGGDRREEIFVSKAELRAKVSDLDEADRRVFQPLELGDLTGPAPTRPSTRPTSVPDPKALAFEVAQAAPIDLTSP
jgi:hypothetical protein